MWFSLLRWFGRAVLSQKNVGKPTKAAVNVPAKNLEQDLPNYKWDQQFAGTKYGGATKKNHLRGLRKQPNPARIFAVLDAMGATCHWYKPGTEWCYKCCTRVDEETRFTSHPDYKPPVLRTTELQAS